MALGESVLRNVKEYKVTELFENPCKWLRQPKYIAY